MKSEKINLLAMFIVAVLSFISCGSKETDQIYICGQTPEHHAFYYLNGVQKLLCLESHPSAAYDIDVKDGTVYCGGYLTSTDSGKKIATLWKDGNAISITDGTNNAILTDFQIKGNNIYCVGLEEDGDTYKKHNISYSDYECINYDRAKLWIVNNGKVVKTLSLTKGKGDARANSVYVDDDDLVHIVGYDHKRKYVGDEDSRKDSRYWIVEGNTGVLIKTEALFVKNGSGTAVWGSDDVVMAGGYIDDDVTSTGGWDAIYWKDGLGRNLSSDYETVIEDGCMIGDDWYMCGYSRDVNALYYKNGQMIFLSEGKNGFSSKAYSMTSANDDIYVCGISSGNNGYWKNARFIHLEELFGCPYGIDVIPSRIEKPKENPKLKKSERVIAISGSNQLRALQDESGYNFYSLRLNSDNNREFEKVSDIVFDGQYERLNIEGIEDSENMLILNSGQGKYLWSISDDCFMLDGNSFNKMEKDNAGGVAVKTKEGFYHISDLGSCLGKFEQYFRSGTLHDMLLYKTNGKWGVYCKLMKPSGIYSKYYAKYVEILPAEYDKIKYVFGDGANHFVCQKNGKWEIRDAYGRKREMCKNIIMKLNTERTVNREYLYTTAYINKVREIQPGLFEEYNSFFKTDCTCSGDDEACVILLKYHANSWQGLFYNGDESRRSLPWLDSGERWEYNYYGVNY